MGLLGGAAAAPAPAATSAPPPPPRQPFVGDVVYLEGTGRWWAGSKFRATVADVRTDDDTVKVRYDDGGYKRFPKEKFIQLVASDWEDGDGEGDFGSEPYEWADDVMQIISDNTDDVRFERALEALRDDVRQAVKKHDFLLADKKKKEIGELRRSHEEVKLEKAALAQAIKATDFQKAHEIQQRIDKLRKGGEVKDATSAKDPPLSETLAKAAKRAFGGGIAGAGAMVIQVTALMWMRTTMNYQYRHGTSTMTALRTLYADGGIRRFYRGLGPALLQGPLSRFGDTAANAGMLALLDGHENTRNLPVAIKTMFSSGAAAVWRIFLMPVDTVKTILQVEGKDGIAKLRVKQRIHGPTVFYHGAIGASAATFVGHYPWFATYNYLDHHLPVPHERFNKLARNAGIGFCASAVSDTVSNSIRVLKTYRQTNDTKVSYAQAAQEIIAKDGYSGLFGRGLSTRIVANGMQGMMFSVLWKFFQEQIRARSE
eukprot:TRINITY_DN17206_c0_g1_i1.p1 TRINITY_DN17206_c0_g1~~TRINITY_DN17206_c0_g1_i1.p1  ORF type:complete len:485 (+),score=183.29 TRINITY_DN17206_c0_g1_i1:80-1534(+)